MLRNQITIALRALRRHFGYTSVNVLGLAIGMAASLLILLYVRHQLSYDQHHENADRIHRVWLQTFREDGSEVNYAVISARAAPTLMEEFPDFEAVARVAKANAFVEQGDKGFYEDRFLYADPGTFDVFTFDLLQGDPETALQGPWRVVLTETTARKYFGAEDPMGRTLTINDSLNYEVTGVMADPSGPSHMNFDLLASYESFTTLFPNIREQWSALSTHTYLLLKPGANPEAVAQKIADVNRRHFQQQNPDSDYQMVLHLQPLTDIHFNANFRGELEAGSDITHVYVFALVAAFILLIAAINFTNLATAQAAARAREVGVRKVLGSSRWQLVRQHLTESLVFSLLGLLLALGLAFLVRPLFNALAGVNLALNFGRDPWLLPLFLLVGIAVGLLAGMYPAFFLSGMPTIASLKGRFQTIRRGVWLRQGLVVFQFAISIGLIAATAVVLQQFHYMQQYDTGFTKAQVIVISTRGYQAASQRHETIKEAMRAVPGVTAVAASHSVPGRGVVSRSVRPEGADENALNTMLTLVIDHDFIPTYDVEVIAGRNFSRDFPADATENFVLNEAAVRSVGWTPEEAIGKGFLWAPDRQGQVVGVVRDFNYLSLQQGVEPLVMLVGRNAFSYFSARVETAHMPATLAALERTWKEVVPERPFEYFFLDEDYAKQYGAERQLSRMFGVLAFLAIFIACLGLFALTTLMVAQRRKEVGVRKVLGASVPGLVVLLARDFMGLVLLAFVVAGPLAYLAMSRWLDGFAYRVSLGPGVFVLAAGLALLIAFLTVSYQALRAATANPVEALRHE